MKTFAWTQALADHSVFSALDEKQRERLLDDDVSEERNFRSEEIILKEGEPGDSVFVIGSGSVAVTLQAPDVKPVSVARLGPRELFGEMAVLEQRNRAANVVAAEPCIILEIKGAAFLEILRENPKIEFRVLLLLSQRLREVGEHVLSIRLIDVDEKLQMFDNKLNAELKAIDASLRAAQTVFEQTSARANEVIESADRSRTRRTAAISTIGGIITIVFSALAFFGYSEVKGLQSYRMEAEEFLEKIKTTNEKITIQSGTISKKITIINNNVEKVTKLENELNKITFSANEARMFLYKNIITSSFTNYFSSEPEVAAITFQKMIRINDDELTDHIFTEINRELFVGEEIERSNAVDFLSEHALNARFGDNHYAKLLSYYLLLMGLVLDMTQTTSDGDAETNLQYQLTIREFSRYLPVLNDSYKRESKESYKHRLKEKFDPDNFKEIIDIISSPEAINDEKRGRLKDLIDEVWSKI